MLMSMRACFIIIGTDINVFFSNLLLRDIFIYLPTEAFRRVCHVNYLTGLIPTFLANGWREDKEAPRLSSVKVIN